ncbi:MAG TPA: rhamnan synthesis F family protein [Rhodocyclaceae bacterium]|nr:rhamnan synthesis F family protein [Rhodocyclaceae bacterium]
MHPSALKYGKAFFDTYLLECDPQQLLVVDVGSQDVNGSLRQFSPVGARYIGVDFSVGAGVDVVMSDPYSLPFETATADAVVCSSVFEHSEFFWLLFVECLRILKPTGLLYLSAPSNGMVHRYPVDSWRFYPDAGHALINWARRNGEQPVLLESFIAPKLGPVAEEGMWNDFVAVFAKDERHSVQHSRRILNDEPAAFCAFAHGKEIPWVQSAINPDNAQLVALETEIGRLKRNLAICQADDAHEIARCRGEPSGRDGRSIVCDALSGPTKPPSSDDPQGIIQNVIEAKRPPHSIARIAVVVHLFYLDLLDEILNHLTNIPEPFDVFVTTPFEADIPHILNATARRGIPTTAVLTKNRGRDVGPFVTLYRTRRLNRYEAVLKLHSKKTPQVDAGDVWRRKLYAQLCGNSLTVRRYLTLLREHDCGVAGPTEYFLTDPQAWHSNKEMTRHVLIAAQVQGDGDEPSLGFFTGTMFWFAPNALSRLTTLSSDLLCFDEEHGQKDGTLAHALERVFAQLARGSGYRVGGVEAGGMYIFESDNSADKVLVQTADTTELILRAREFIAHQHLTDAHDLLMRGLQAEPDNPCILVELGKVAFLGDMPQDGHTIFEHAATLSHDVLPDILQFGKDLFQKSDSENGLLIFSLLERIIAKNLPSGTPEQALTPITDAAKGSNIAKKSRIDVARHALHRRNNERPLGSPYDLPADTASANGVAEDLRKAQLVIDAKQGIERAIALYDNGKLEEAYEAFHALLGGRQSNPQVLVYLGLIALRRALPDEAQKFFERAVECSQDPANTMAAIGQRCMEHNALDFAERWLSAATQARPDLSGAFALLADVLVQQARQEDALQLLDSLSARGAADLAVQSRLVKLAEKLADPQAECKACLRASAYPDSHARAIALLPYCDDSSIYMIRNEAERFASRHGINKGACQSTGSRQRLKLGFVSDRFAEGEITARLEPLFDALDPTLFETFIFAAGKPGGEAAQHLFMLADEWILTAELDATAISRTISKRSIDVLINLDGHASLATLAFFNHRHAPLQLNWTWPPQPLALPAVDRTLLDPLVPPDIIDALTEESALICHPTAFSFPPLPARLPSDDAAPCVFGCMQPLNLVDRQSWLTWAEILRAVPDASLHINAGDAEEAGLLRVQRLFEAQEIAPSRIVFVRADTARTIGEAWQCVDLGLSPLAGDSSHALLLSAWAARACVALDAGTPWTRTAASILRKLRHDTLIAVDRDHYVATAVRLASDRSKLRCTGQALRGSLQRSPLTDAEGFARAFGNTLVQLWQSAGGEMQTEKREGAQA